MRVFVIAIAIATVVALPNVNEWQMEFKKQKTMQQPTKLTAFAFKDCGGNTPMLHIKDLSVTPDPLAFPGPLNVAANITINKDIGQPLKGTVVIQKKVLGKFVKIPCIDNFGSCTYDDLCELLEQVQCPDQLVKIGIDCRCPLKTKSYMLPKTEFDVEASVIPAGEYNITGNATLGDNAEAACLNLHLTFQ